MKTKCFDYFSSLISYIIYKFITKYEIWKTFEIQNINPKRLFVQIIKNINISLIVVVIFILSIIISNY